MTIPFKITINDSIIDIKCQANTFLILAKERIYFLKKYWAMPCSKIVAAHDRIPAYYELVRSVLLQLIHRKVLILNKI